MSDDTVVGSAAGGNAEATNLSVARPGRGSHFEIIKDCFSLMHFEAKSVTALRLASVVWAACVHEMLNWVGCFVLRPTSQHDGRCVLNVPSTPLFATSMEINISTLISIEQLRVCEAYIAFVLPRLVKHNVNVSFALALAHDATHCSCAPWT